MVPKSVYNLYYVKPRSITSVSFILLQLRGFKLPARDYRRKN